ncbi:hypothetical protein PPSQR21_026340 [Paenibacillus polymyxa SQR-21]|uniref:hypothetical protein n=1 Tax=Paenibacillus sp. P2(2022) TaxID=2917813 RepID=UPI00042EC134|nr:hypothetical protein PPSQR21_026340 [Paenibacillus polymyxa SQR-21]
MINKLHWLPVGQLDIDRSSLNHHAQPGELVRLQIWSYLLETDHGPILIDTGMPDSFIDNPDYFKNTPFEGRFIPRMTADDSIVAVLDRIGSAINQTIFMPSLSPICIWIMPEAIRIFRIHRFMCSRPKQTLRSVI